MIPFPNAAEQAAYVMESANGDICAALELAELNLSSAMRVKDQKLWAQVIWILVDGGAKC